MEVTEHEWHNVRGAHLTRSGSRSLQVQLSNPIDLWAECYVIFIICVSNSGDHDLVEIGKTDSKAGWWVGGLSAVGSLESLKLDLSWGIQSALTTEATGCSGYAVIWASGAWSCFPGLPSACGDSLTWVYYEVLSLPSVFVCLSLCKLLCMFV